MRRRALTALIAWAAAGTAASQPVAVSEWAVPWDRSGPRETFVDPGGRVWFTGQRGDLVGNLTPETGLFSRYDLAPGTGPVGLVVDADGVIWYAAGDDRHLGRLDPATARITKIEMPERKARDPHALAADESGDLWFTVPRGNFVGRLSTATNALDLVELPERKLEPQGIAIDSRGVPWIAAAGDNRLIRVDPGTLAVTLVELPEKRARPRRIGITSDDRVWWGDYGRGALGAYDPAEGAFMEWRMPAGDDSRPDGLAVDRNDRIWIAETGVDPNRLVGFDPATGRFFSETEIPSGGEGVPNLHYYEDAGEVWFATGTHYIGRAVVH